jgi:hypothetical protein
VQPGAATGSQEQQRTVRLARKAAAWSRAQFLPDGGRTSAYDSYLSCAREFKFRHLNEGLMPGLQDFEIKQIRPCCSKVEAEDPVKLFSCATVQPGATS